MLARARRSAATVQSRLGRDVRAWIGLDGEWSAFELDLDELFALVPERILYRDVITYPPLRQDLAFVVDETCAGRRPDRGRTRGGRRRSCARRGSCRDYRGDQIPAGKKSLAFAVAFQSAERTLTDDDGTRLRAAIVEALADRFGAELRPDTGGGHGRPPISGVA